MSCLKQTQLDVPIFLRSQLNMDADTLSNIISLTVIRHFNFSLREMERYVRLIKIASLEPRNMYIGFPEQNAVAFAMTYIVPVMIGLQMFDMDEYKDFISGKAPQQLCEILEKSGVVTTSKFFISRNEVFDSQTHTIKDKAGQSISVQERIEKIYRAIFSNNSPYGDDRVLIGEMEFSKETKRAIDRIVSMLSPLSDYEFE